MNRLSLSHQTSFRAAMLAKQLQCRKQPVVVHFPNLQISAHGDQRMTIAAEDLLHIRPENAFVWWYIIEQGTTQVGWRIAAQQYARRYARAFVVDDNHTITAIINRCNLSFFRASGEIVDPDVQLLMAH